MEFEYSNYNPRGIHVQVPFSIYILSFYYSPINLVFVLIFVNLGFEPSLTIRLNNRKGVSTSTSSPWGIYNLLQSTLYYLIRHVHLCLVGYYTCCTSLGSKVKISITCFLTVSYLQRDFCLDHMTNMLFVLLVLMVWDTLWECSYGNLVYME